MCLSIPARIVSVEGDRGVADIGGNRREVNLSLVEGISPGDYVLVHVGFAIQKYDQKEAEELLALWKKIDEVAS